MPFFYPLTTIILIIFASDKFMPFKKKYSTIILSTAYFPPVEYFFFLNHSKNVLIDSFENYQKQTYRNRCIIYGSNGPLSLVIPVIKTNKPKTIFKDILISYDEDWQKVHWRSISAAYNSSPFFLYYQDDILKILEKKHRFLIDLNNELLMKLLDLTNIDTSISQASSYIKDPEELDLRNTISPKNKIQEILNYPSYIQVFDDKHGFISNLSILDLLFNEGPNTLEYLKKICH